MKSSWVRTGSASVVLLCLGIANVYVSRVVKESHWYLVLIMMMLLTL